MSSKYGKTDPAERQKFRDRLTKGNWWRAKEGTNHIRVLPPAEGANKWWHEWTLHWSVGPMRAVVPCLEVHGVESKKCAICEEVARLRSSSSKEDQTLAEAMERQWRVIVNIVDLDAPNLGVQKLLTGTMIAGGLIDYDTDEDYGDIDDPQEGFNIRIIRGPKGSQPLYTVKAARERSVLPDMSWLESLDDLSKAFRVYTYEEQKALLKGSRVRTVSGDKDEFEGDEDPRSRREEKSESASQPAERETPEVSVAKSTRARPRCFGKYAGDDDKICQRCKSREQCKSGSTTSVEDKKEEETSKPRCFRRKGMYDPKDVGCQECVVRKECAPSEEG